MIQDLFEGVACYERHPWDVRGKVGSERKFATSDKSAETRQSSPKLGVAEIVGFIWGFRPRGPPNIGFLIGESGRKRTL